MREISSSIRILSQPGGSPDATLDQSDGGGVQQTAWRVRADSNLPALFREIFDFSDGMAPRALGEDFYAVRGDIWLEKQIVPLRVWVRKFNNVLRVQVEGEANLTIPITDMVSATAAVDRPEHENLFVGDEIDNYLPMALAYHMTGNLWNSHGVLRGIRERSYAQTFQDTVIRMHRSFAGGITKLVYHVYPYRDGARPGNGRGITTSDRPDFRMRGVRASHIPGRPERCTTSISRASSRR